MCKQVAQSKQNNEIAISLQYLKENGKNEVVFFLADKGPYIKYVGGDGGGGGGFEQRVFMGVMKYFRYILWAMKYFSNFLMSHKIFYYVLFS